VTGRFSGTAHELLCKFAARHIRYGHIGDHQVKAVRMRTKESQRFEAACLAYNFIPQTSCGAIMFALIRKNGHQ
jgi:hypothetical protein